MNNELRDYLAPLEVDVPKKKKLTKFDILMLNPKSLPRKEFKKLKSPQEAREEIEKRNKEEDEQDMMHEGEIEEQDYEEMGSLTN